MFDIYRKVPQDLTQPTKTGAIISIATITFCLYLLIWEFNSYLESEIISEVYVDDPVKSYEYIPVFINISLLKMPCKLATMTIQDDIGRSGVGYQVSNSHKEINDGQGCLLQSSFRVAKVSGSFMLSTPDPVPLSESDSLEALEAVTHEAALTVPKLDHIIHALSFGNTPRLELRHAFIEVSSFTPLDDRAVTDSEQGDSHDYYLKIVPSIFDTRNYRLYPYQFTSVYRKLPLNVAHPAALGRPAIWFRYETAPVVVKYLVYDKPFYHFLTQVCAIVGGSFTVAGIVDKFLFSTSQLFVKARLGKLP